MTRSVGLPSGMDPFELDLGTSERLVTGAVDAGDAPPEYRAVARTLQGLRAAPERSEWAGEPAAVERIIVVVVDHRRPSRRERRTRRSPSRVARLVAATAVVGVVCVTSAFASAGALPQPAQRATSAVLDTVGISVPSGNEEPASTNEPPPASPDTAPPVATSPAPAPSPPKSGTSGAVPGSSAPGPENDRPSGNDGNGTRPDKEGGYRKDNSSGEHKSDNSPPHGQDEAER